MHLLTRSLQVFALIYLILGEGNGKEAIQQTVDGANKFAVNLYKELASGQQNVFFSPISVDMVLSMVYFGAGGLTAQQIQRVLDIPSNSSEAETSYKAITRDLKEVPREVILELANKIYVDKSGDVRTEYVEKIKDIFKSDVSEGDFKDGKEAVVNDINSWASSATHGKINNVISKDNVLDDTRLIALNAVYFYGKWHYLFNKDISRKEQFFLNKDSSVETTMMFQQADFPYGEYDDFQVLKMNYKGKDTSMLILLPTEKDGLPNLEAKLHELDLNDINGRLWERKVSVTFPKFKMETDMQLKSILIKMGISEIFGFNAEFGPLAKKRMYVQDVVQKAFVEVTEEGTEAAAVTGFSLIPRPAPPPPPPKIFKADHPFIFFIQDELSKVILFMGRFAKP